MIWMYLAYVSVVTVAHVRVNTRATGVLITEYEIERENVSTPVNNVPPAVNG